MASISSPETDIGIANGTGGWDPTTANSCTHLIHAQSIGLSAQHAVFTNREVGFDNFITAVIRLSLTVDVTLTCDMTHEGSWIQILAHVFGAQSTPAEQTGGEGDYLHVLYPANTTSGKYQVLAWKIEDNRVIEIPSVKWHTVSVSTPVNEVGTITFQGIGSGLRVDGGAANTASGLNALAYPPYEPAVYGGANANDYFRLDAYSASVALTSADDKGILSLSWEFARPMQRIFCLRGASSQYTKEPKQLSQQNQMMTFQMCEIDDAAFNDFAAWLGQTRLMAIASLTGAQIGAGLNRLIQFRFSSVELAGSVPGGFDVQGQSLMQPTFVFNSLATPTVPAGFTTIGGFSNYSIQCAVITSRVAAYV